MRRFALDQNFPLPIVDVLARYIVEAELVALSAIDPALTRDTEDWQVLLALHKHAEHWDGLITTDSGMLLLPKEMAVLCQTNLTLVVAEGVGHDPVKATGLVLAHLPGICEKTDPEVPQLWVLRAATQPHEKPWDRLRRRDAQQARREGALQGAQAPGKRSRQGRSIAHHIVSPRHYLSEPNEPSSIDSEADRNQRADLHEILLPRGCHEHRDQRGPKRTNRNTDSAQAYVVIAGTRDG